MSNFSRFPPQTDPLSPRETLPTMYDLPSEDPEEPGLPDVYHDYQPQLLRETFKPINYNSEEVFTASDLNLYYDRYHTNWHKRPDWFGVVGVSRRYDGYDMRLSYVIWQELVSPFVVVELLSPGTEDEDLGRTIAKPGKPPTKWQVYEQILGIPYYVVFSRYTNEMQAFNLVGTNYEAVELTEGQLPIPELGLSLGLWEGRYESFNRQWLRWFTASGELILTPEEEAQAAQAEAQAAQRRAERLAAKLRELNIDPDGLD